jgi:hypothetical protein
MDFLVPSSVLPIATYGRINLDGKPADQSQALLDARYKNMVTGEFRVLGIILPQDGLVTAWLQLIFWVPLCSRHSGKAILAFIRCDSFLRSENVQVLRDIRHLRVKRGLWSDPLQHLGPKI